MQDITSAFTFKEIFELLVGVIIFVYAFYQVYSLLSTQCWTEVTGSMKELFTQNLRPGGRFEVKMDPACLKEIIMTDDAGECNRACDRDRECMKRCRGEDKTFIVLVRKEDEKGLVAGASRWVFRTVETIKKTAFEHNEVFIIMCNLVDEQRIIECKPGEKAKVIEVQIGGDQDNCYIGRNRQLPPLCRLKQ